MDSFRNQLRDEYYSFSYYRSCLPNTDPRCSYRLMEYCEEMIQTLFYLLDYRDDITGSFLTEFGEVFDQWREWKTDLMQSSDLSVATSSYYKAAELMRELVHQIMGQITTEDVQSSFWVQRMIDFTLTNYNSLATDEDRGQFVEPLYYPFQCVKMIEDSLTTDV